MSQHGTHTPWTCRMAKKIVASNGAYFLKIYMILSVNMEKSKYADEQFVRNLIFDFFPYKNLGKFHPQKSIKLPKSGLDGLKLKK